MKIIAIKEEAFQVLIKRIKSLENRYDLLQEELIRDRLYSSKEVQAILKVGRDSLQRYRDSGRLSFIKTGKTIRYRWSDIESFLSNK